MEEVILCKDLAKYLVDGPLYRRKTIENARVVAQRSPIPGAQVTYVMSAPKEVRRGCGKCGSEQNWKLVSSADITTGFEELNYVCKNCDGSSYFRVWLYFSVGAKTVTVEKVGQYPRLEVAIPKEFEKALGDKRPLYVKGMTSRHNSYGIGALTYFRRLIEDTTDEMLNLLQEAMMATGADPTAIEKLKKAKEGTRFDDKMKIAAEVMPAHLRPGGINPFGDLYGLLSIGLHDLTDEECCDIVDAMDRSLKFIYAQLKTHAEDAKAYHEAARSISAKLTELKKGNAE